MLIVQDVYKKLGNTTVLKDISFTVQRNTVVGLAGVSGSGKSTLLRCIQNLDIPDQGTITCDGKVGFVFQDFQLFPHMTILRNVMYALNLNNQKKSVGVEEKAVMMLTELGLGTQLNHYPNHLSGGQKQRAALARSLILHPDLLLCDEPTSGLDFATIEDVVTLLKSLQQNNGLTMLIASHDLSFLSKIVDSILIMRHGSIVATIELATTPNPIELLKTFYSSTETDLLSASF